MKSRWRLLVTIFTIVAVAMLLRLYQLDGNPPEFFEDEIAAATSAWSIVTTGHDVERTTLPFIRTRLVFQQPVYPFSTVPFWALFGHRTVPARLPAAIYGVASVLLIAWLARVLGRSQAEALAAAAVMAALPWAVHYSRIGQEPASTVPFTLGGVGLLWTGIVRANRQRVIAGAAVLALGAYTYLPAMVMNIILAGLIVVVLRQRIDDRPAVAIGAAAAVLILVPYAVVWRDPLFTARPKRISVFADGVNLDAFDKVWGYYWQQWSPKGLFGSSSLNLRDKPGGMLFWWILPFLIVGIISVARRRKPSDIFLLAWLVLGPLPAALNYDGPIPHFARGIVTMPAIAMVTSIGVFRAFQLFEGRHLSRRALAAAVASVVVYEGLVYYRDYFDRQHGYPARSASWWYYGTGRALAAVRDTVPPGGTVCIDGVSYFTFAHHVVYYFGPRPRFTVREGLRNEECWRAGTYVLARPEHPIAAGAEVLRTIPGYDGEPVFMLSRVRRS